MIVIVNPAELYFWIIWSRPLKHSSSLLDVMWIIDLYCTCLSIYTRNSTQFINTTSMHNSMFELLIYIAWNLNVILYYRPWFSLYWHAFENFHLWLIYFLSIAYNCHLYWTIWYHVGGYHVLEVLHIWYAYISLGFLDNLALSICMLTNAIIFSSTVVTALAFGVVYRGLKKYTPRLFIFNLMVPPLVWTMKKSYWCGSYVTLYFLTKLVSDNIFAIALSP